MENIETTYSLSPMQQGMLFHTIYAQHRTGTYIEQFCITLHSDLDTLSFKQAWYQIVEQHAVLRTSFEWEGLSSPIQKVDKNAKLLWLQLDWRMQSQELQKKQLNTLLQSDFTTDFSLTKAPLMRFTLIQTSDNCYEFVWSHHHILLDGCSLSIILKQVFSQYEAACHNKTTAVKQSLPYHNYISWVQQQSADNAQAFWSERLKDFTLPTLIQTDKLSQNTTTSAQGDYTEQQIKLSKATTEALSSLAHQYSLSLNSLIQGAWALLLSYYTGKSDITFGATIWQRPAELPEVETMVGLAINTLPVRIQFSANDDLIPSLQKWHKQLLELEQYAYASLLDIQRWSELSSGMPLFDSIVFFDDFPINSHSTEHFSSLKIGQVRHRGRTDYPVTIVISPGDELLLRFMYDCDCFDSSKINQIMGQLKTILDAISSNPQQKLYELAQLPPEQIQQIRNWNNTAIDYPAQCLHQLFETQVERTPDNIAVIYKGQQLSYSSLNSKANQLAHHLRNLGIKADVLVGIYIERCIEMPIGLLGILKAGGGYVPLDPILPTARLASMITDAKLTVILTLSHLAQQLSNSSAQIICLDNDFEQYLCLSHENPECNVVPFNLAYVIYTSGSTGKPKGVMIPHQAIVNHTLWMQEKLPLNHSDKVLQKTPFCFDASVWEFYAPLIAGAQLIIAQPGAHLDPAKLSKIIKEDGITILQLVPSVLRVILQQQEFKYCHSLKRIFCGGEVLQQDVIQLCLEMLNVQFYNLYGPTESCIDSIFTLCQKDEDQSIVPIGRPIANTQIYILDNNQRHTPAGVSGEIYISGAGLARGYLNDPELSAEKFIEIKLFEKTERLYKTGDFAKYLADGNIEYLGRIDHQVKLRGLRIELGEIELSLLKFPGISEALVTLQDEFNDKRLVAYISYSQQTLHNPDELSLFLTKRLPEYMIPSAFVVLDKFPLMANGKIDRKALPSTNKASLRSKIGYVAPNTLIEQRLVNLWQDILHVDHLSIHDNFFKLGGHSLLAMQLIVHINKQFQLDFPLHLLFDSPTIAESAVQLALIQERKSSSVINTIKALPRIKN